jgi:hypothetical protein
MRLPHDFLATIDKPKTSKTFQTAAAATVRATDDK